MPMEMGSHRTKTFIYAPILFMHLQNMAWLVHSAYSRYVALDIFSNFSIGTQAKLCEGDGALRKMAGGGGRGGINGL